MKRVFYFVDHTVSSDVNSGVQRVVRGLARGLLASGAPIVPVTWSSGGRALALATHSQLRNLERWNWPVFSSTPRRDRRKFDLASVVPWHRGTILHESVQYGSDIPGSWLLVPEVTHITSHASSVTDALIQYARSHAMRLAFVFYDALPLRYDIYRDMRQRHTEYMRALAQADCVLPISHTAAQALREFFTIERIEPLTCVLPCTLPGEFPSEPRTIQPSREKPEVLNVLSVGSIDSRKNQASLIRVFQALSGKYPSDRWALTLAGHVSGELSALVSTATRERSVRFVPAPTDEQIAALYRDCYFTAFPSIDEGFGLPIVESLWFAKPCLCANFGAMREAAEGGGCLMVDTRSPNELLGALESMLMGHDRVLALQDEILRRRIKTWSDYAGEVMEALGQSIERKSAIT